MTALLIVSLAANLVLGIRLIVRLVRPDDRLQAAELSAAIDYATRELSSLDGRIFLRLLSQGPVDAAQFAERFPGWRAYRDRHMAVSQDLTV